MDHFELVSPYKPMGDQPEAIDRLVSSVFHRFARKKRSEMD